jgi:serine phosphatase RsbU (regulator of sigma subunit)
MSLRLRLIIAFLVLSVVPLTAVTLFWYTSSVRAFERAAQREATDNAADISRRMQLITTDVGRRMDQVFAAEDDGDPNQNPDPDRIRARIAPVLGDAAALVESVEFHPAEAAAAASAQAPVTAVPPPPAAVPQGPRHGPGSPGAPDVPPPPGARGPRPPTAPGVIVVDVPRILADARARGNVDAEVSRQLRNLGSLIDGAIAQGWQAGAAAAEVKRREAAAEASARATDGRTAAVPTAVDMNGRRLEVMVHKHGRFVGKANATLNMNRVLGTVLALARREQGEIAFAIDRQGTLFTADDGQRATLEGLGISTEARQAAAGKPRRVDDWVVVAHRDDSGLVLGIARPIGETLREIRRMSFRNLSIGLLVIALACVGIVPVSHRMTEQVSSLSAGVKQLAGGDFKARVPVRSSDEFGALAAAFNRMAEDLERHEALVVEQERLRRELELSRLIQTEMLPRGPLRLGTAEIRGVSIPAREVGGDLFNYFALPDGRLALLVGDVSGKGVSAALLMANVQATLRARLPLERSLTQLAEALDREIDATTPRGVYVTLFLGILDAGGRAMHYVNAGHNPVFVCRAGGAIQPLSSTGMPIGLYAGQGYTERIVEVSRGDLLFFYTDGLVETENEAGDMFGTERLQSLLEAEHRQDVDTVLERVDAAVRAFRGRAEPLDDATMMALTLNA